LRAFASNPYLAAHRDESMTTGSPQHLALTAPDEAVGNRLDKWLAEAQPALSRSRLRHLIEAGKVRLGDAPVTDASAKVVAGGVYTVELPPPAAATPQPENIPLDIVYEDEHLIVVDKPPGRRPARW